MQKYRFQASRTKFHSIVSIRKSNSINKKVPTRARRVSRHFAVGCTAPSALLCREFRAARLCAPRGKRTEIDGERKRISLIYIQINDTPDGATINYEKSRGILFKIYVHIHTPVNEPFLISPFFSLSLSIVDVIFRGSEPRGFKLEENFRLRYRYYGEKKSFPSIMKKSWEDWVNQSSRNFFSIFPEEIFHAFVFNL